MTNYDGGISCNLCGKMLTSLDVNNLCGKCEKEMEDYKKRIKEHLEKSPRLSASQISRDLDISMKIIKYLMDDNFFSESPALTQRKCAMCNETIKPGKQYCEKHLIFAMSTEVKKMRPNANNLKDDKTTPVFHTKRINNGKK